MGPGNRVPGNLGQRRTTPDRGQLQWGPGIASRETGRQVTTPGVSLSGLQWGPGIASRETSRCCETNPATWARFNGARESRPGKPDLLGDDAQPLLLQWGPGIASRETGGGRLLLG